MEMNICVYTVITNDYDKVKPVTIKTLPHYLFTDNPNLKAEGWNIVLVDTTEGCRLQRKIKLLGHSELDKYDATLYIDASMTLKQSVLHLLRKYRGGFIIGSHPERKCVYAEGLAVKKLKKAPADLVNAQIAEYYENDFPANFGMWSAGFLLRDKTTKAFCELWYEKLMQHSHRDQLSLPWAVWKTGIRPKEVDFLNYVSMTPHNKKIAPKVYYSTPWNSSKNIGKANNEFIELLPDDCWICITDADAMFLNSDFGARVERIVKDFGNEYGLIGCLTNRIGSPHQCYGGEFSENTNIRHHYDIAQHDLPHKVIDGGVAGFFMLFSKETWRRAGGFKEHSISTDTDFNNRVRKLKLKVGVYQGLYMFHQYRIWSDNPKTDKKHLK